jgi:CheY-like chemotaxis protein
MTMPNTVLLMEDETDIREAIEEVLASEGFSVVSVPDGEAGLAWLVGGGQPSVVLLDMVMPRLSGWDVMERLRGDPRLAALKVVAMSGSPEVRGPLAAVLQKPFELSDLVDTVRRLSGTSV